MDSRSKTIIAVLASVLVATGIACAIFGVQGLLVALICLCMIELYAMITDGWHAGAALTAVVLLNAVRGFDLIPCVGVQVLLVVLICLCMVEFWGMILEGLLDTAALVAAAAVIVLFGLNPLVWLGGASVVICIAVIAILIAVSR